ncbi:type II toxin-antitoxin system ParD family antitoxin [Paludisphaera sp.]|uniref:type II toxin-antitoxin system ParD family antitoxin n=1 Tax=Paludisphaera sp. TaxID=2017432 RepID=UPI00301D78B2
MATVNVSLPDPMKEFVESQARKEGFVTVSEYLHSLIREAQKREARQALESKLAEGLESGPSAPMTSEEWDDIGREGIELAARRRGR